MSRDHSDPPAPSLVTILPALFPSSERVRLGLVLLTSVLVAFFEVVGVASILPFFAILMDPTAVDRYAWLAKMLGALGVAGSTDRILALGVLTAAVIVLSNAASAIGMWSQQWYVARTKTRISVAICDAYLAPPLEYHTKHDAPSLLKVIYNDVEPLSVLLPAPERSLSSALSSSERASKALICSVLARAKSRASSLVLSSRSEWSCGYFEREIFRSSASLDSAFK